MDIIKHTLNCNRFFPIDDEQMTGLEMIGNVIKKTNEIVEKTNDLEKDVKDKITEKEVTQRRKLLANGDFRGSWHGIKNPAYVKELEQAVITNMFETISNLVVYMPEPSTVEENTANLQGLLDLALIGNNSITIKFNKGVYELNECYIHANTTIELHTETKLITKGDLLFMNARREIDNKFTVYNGNGNITFRGGQVQGHFMSMIHGQNILIENVKFSKCETNHYIEICACKNVTIKNCDFEGMIDVSSSANYAEYIQIDICTYKAFPRFAEGSICFDLTPNDTIEVLNCKFIKCCSHNFLGVAVGSHSWDTNHPKHKNITIKNCTVEGATYGAFRIYNWDNAVLENNKTISCTKDIVISQPSASDKSVTGEVIIKENTFENTKSNSIFVVGGTTTSYGGKLVIKENVISIVEDTDIMNIKYINDLTIKDNIVKGGKRLGNYAYCSNINITENDIINFQTYGLSLISCKNTKITNNTFKDSVMLANSTRVINLSDCNTYTILNNIINNVRGIDMFYAVALYNSDNGVVDNNKYVNCTNNKNVEVYKTGSTIYSSPYGKLGKHLLYNGSVASGTITLLDEISKYDTIAISTGAVGDFTFISQLVLAYNGQVFSPSEHNKILCNSANGKIKITVNSDNLLTINQADDNVRQIWGIEG